MSAEALLKSRFSGHLCSFALPSEAHELDGLYGQNLEHRYRLVESESGLFKKIPQVAPMCT